MHTFFRNVDQTIESAFVSRAEVDKACAPQVCSFRPYLRIYYIGIDGRQCVMSICQTELRDPVSVIADYISDLKSKSMAF